jgi:hypothetical protein
MADTPRTDAVFTYSPPWGVTTARSYKQIRDAMLALERENAELLDATRTLLAVLALNPDLRSGYAACIRHAEEAIAKAESHG